MRAQPRKPPTAGRWGISTDRPYDWAANVSVKLQCQQPSYNPFLPSYTICRAVVWSTLMLSLRRYMPLRAIIAIAIAIASLVVAPRRAKRPRNS